jgi:hypothetical protein
MTEFAIADPTSLSDQELCRLIGELEPRDWGGHRDRRGADRRGAQARSGPIGQAAALSLA